MKATLIFTVAAVALLQQTWACMSDDECSGGCCYESQCHQYQNISQACHLPDHEVTIMHFPCGCAEGLFCDEIHFLPSFGDPVHDAESLLLTKGYGYCTDTPGFVFG